jgi:isopenicillin N synthase-like dioxygenase
MSDPTNPMDTAAKLGQQLFEIQNDTITNLTNMQQRNLENYFELTRNFTTKLPEATDPQKMMELQREMTETLWQSYQQSNESTGELVRNAWDQVGEAYRSAFTPEDKS